MASHAAAHGCDPAPVRQEIRVGTGWRLHVLVAQRQEASAERRLYWPVALLAGAPWL